VQTIADIEAHPHWQARGLTLDVPNGSEGVRMHNVVPRLSETPGQIQWAGGELGQDNDTVYGALGLTPDDQARLRASG
jgi:crotonobetainyl-CoA:carnitine CoA-transferase CaiB-like acyl-CoA transferase